MFLKFALRLPYRQTEGIARKLLSFLGVKVPNFRTLHYRFTKEEINLQDLPQVRDLPQDFVIVLDSTGLKVTNRREWIRKKHSKRPRKGWVKLHVALDMNSWQVINIEVTNQKVHDSQKGKRAWKRANGYGKRWFVESYFSVFKRWFGEYVSSVRFENIRFEVVFKVWILNLFLGMMN